MTSIGASSSSREARSRVVVPSDEGARRERLLEAGDLFGEVSFFDGRPRSADVIALEEGEALVLTEAAFQRLRLTHPRLALRFVLDLGRILGERFPTSDAVAGASATSVVQNRP